MTNEELDLRSLSDDELVQQMHDDLYDGLKEEIEEGVHILLGSRLDAVRRADQGAGRGHAHRRRGFPRRHPVRARGAAGGQCDEGRHVRSCARCWPRPARRKMGKMVIGTVKGDIHDIGKNLVAMMMEGAGFEVINLGINNRSRTT